MTPMWSYVHLGFVALASCLALYEVFGRVPRRFACTCRMFPRYPVHWDNLGLFLEFLCGVLATAAIFMVAVVSDAWGRAFPLIFTLGWAFVSYMAGKQWWKHSKNGRKKLKKKLRDRVKVTAAGLKVVPAPARVAASLALIGALSACGASAGGAEPTPAVTTLSNSDGWTFGLGADT